MQGRKIQLGWFAGFMVTSRLVLMYFLGENRCLAIFLTDPSNEDTSLS